MGVAAAQTAVDGRERRVVREGRGGGPLAVAVLMEGIGSWRGGDQCAAGGRRAERRGLREDGLGDWVGIEGYVSRRARSVGVLTQKRCSLGLRAGTGRRHCRKMEEEIALLRVT